MAAAPFPGLTSGCLSGLNFQNAPHTPRWPHHSPLWYLQRTHFHTFCLGCPPSLSASATKTQLSRLLQNPFPQVKDSTSRLLLHPVATPQLFSALCSIRPDTYQLMERTQGENCDGPSLIVYLLPQSLTCQDMSAPSHWLNESWRWPGSCLPRPIWRKGSLICWEHSNGLDLWWTSRESFFWSPGVMLTFWEGKILYCYVCTVSDEDTEAQKG